MNKLKQKQAYLSSLSNEIKSLSLILIFLAKSGHPVVNMEDQKDEI